MQKRFLFLCIAVAKAFAFDLNVTINAVWEGFVQRNSGREPFLIRRPFSEMPGDSVSEGLGYGLLLSMYCNDQEHFNRLLEGGDATMWNGRWYDWRVGPYGNRVAYGAATDAEQDIAAMLVLADRRVQRGGWSDYRDGYYASRARIILSNLWDHGVTYSGLLRPGYDWGGDEFVNPGYFAPAWYRLFAEFDPDHDWMLVVDTSYAVLQGCPGIEKGLVPDWVRPYSGGYVPDVGYNTYGDGKYMYKDAIRTLWRIGTDLSWNQDPRALWYIENAYQFLQTEKEGIRSANFFQTDGELVPEGDIWVFDGNQKQRLRREHSPLTIGMWLIPIALVGTPEEKQECVDELARFYQPNATFWGLAEGPETTSNNELYFEQFMAEFGALVLADRWKPF